MIPWVVVAQAAAAAAEAIYGYIAARNDATERNRKQKQLISAIELTRTSVLSAVNEATVSELQGALQGYEDRYREYDARPQDEQRLVNMIDDSANTLGWLQTNISKTPSRPGATGDPVAENAAVELALKCVTVFIPMVYLRIQMMTEWQITYRAPAVQDIPPLLKRSIAYLVQVRRWLRKESDARFGLIQTRRSSDHQRYGIGFTF